MKSVRSKLFLTFTVIFSISFSLGLVSCADFSGPASKSTRVSFSVTPAAILSESAKSQRSIVTSSVNVQGKSVSLPYYNPDDMTEFKELTASSVYVADSNGETSYALILYDDSDKIFVVTSLTYSSSDNPPHVAIQKGTYSQASGLINLERTLVWNSGKKGWNSSSKSIEIKTGSLDGFETFQTSDITGSELSFIKVSGEGKSPEQSQNQEFYDSITSASLKISLSGDYSASKSVDFSAEEIAGNASKEVIFDNISSGNQVKARALVSLSYKDENSTHSFVYAYGESDSKEINDGDNSLELYLDPFVSLASDSDENESVCDFEGKSEGSKGTYMLTAYKNASYMIAYEEENGNTQSISAGKWDSEENDSEEKVPEQISFTELVYLPSGSSEYEFVNEPSQKVLDISKDSFELTTKAGLTITFTKESKDEPLPEPEPEPVPEPVPEPEPLPEYTAEGSITVTNSVKKYQLVKDISKTCEKFYLNKGTLSLRLL